MTYTPRLPTARESLKRWSVTFEPDHDVLDAVHRLIGGRHEGGAVIDASGVFRGALTTQDCLRVLASVTWGEQPAGRVCDHLSPRVGFLDIDADLFTMTHAFLGCESRFLAVLDGERSPGLVRRRDLLRASRPSSSNCIDGTATSRRLPASAKPRSIGRLQEIAGTLAPAQLATLLRNRRRYRSR